MAVRVQVARSKIQGIVMDTEAGATAVTDPGGVRMVLAVAG
jgi:hypothetical protein